jgi:hypothetical protein
LVSRFAKGDAVQSQEQRPEPDQHSEHKHQREPGRAGKGRADDKEFAGEDPKRWQPGNRDDAQDQSPAEDRMALGETAHVGDALGALDLGDMTDRKKDCRFGERMHGHRKQAAANAADSANNAPIAGTSSFRPLK